MNEILNYLGITVIQEDMKIFTKLSILRYDFYEINNDIRENCSKNLFNNKNNNEIIIFGKDNKESLKKTFLDKIGAKRCKYLQNFSLRRIYQNKNKITEADNNEIITR